MPTLSKAKKQARRVVCSSHIKQTGIAQIGWSIDHGGYATPIFRGTNGKDADVYGLKGDYFEVGPLWTDLLISDKYATDRNFFRCPDGKPTPKTIAVMKIPVQSHSMFTYGLCRVVGRWASLRIDTKITAKDGKPLDGSTLMSARPSDFILAGDSVSTWPDYVPLYGRDIQFYYVEYFTQSAVTNPALRHLNTGVFLMADGSIVVADKKKLISYKVLERNIVTVNN
jgi:hypothetical protein